jgi:glutamate dehydrogenase (NADP+)
VGGREIGFLFGQYKKLRNEFTGVLTGKGLNWGGSLIRPEATGYGTVYFAAEMLKTRGETLEGKTCLVSGSGNVAQYTTEKLNELGGKVITLSDSGGYIHDEGIDREKLEFIMELKNVKRGRIKEYAEKFPTPHLYSGEPGRRSQPAVERQGRLCVPQRHPERDQRQGRREPVKNGVYVIGEGANMPTVPRVSRSSSSTRSSTARARRPTPVAWRSPAWR